MKGTSTKNVKSGHDYLPAIILEELTGVELAAIPPGVAPLPWSLTMGSENKSGIWASHEWIHVLTQSSHFKYWAKIEAVYSSNKRCRQSNKQMGGKQTYRSRDVPWPLWPWGGLDGHSAAVCPGSLEPLCWPGAGSHCAQTSPTFCGSVYRTNQGTRVNVGYSLAKILVKTSMILHRGQTATMFYLPRMSLNRGSNSMLYLSM